MKKEIDILECARGIKKYCGQRICHGCEFYNPYRYERCAFRVHPIYWEISEKEILDKVEKEYLQNIVKPFKNKVEHIVKMKRSEKDRAFISILIVNDYAITFPDFDSNAMYKGMELNRMYTIEELGL